MKTPLRTTLAILLLLIARISVRAAEVPAFVGRITDSAGILQKSDYMALNELLADYEQKAGNQLFVLTVKSLDGEDIEGFSNRAFRTYGVGQKDKNNGVLLVIALDDRKMRFEVGYGLEGVLPDGRAGQIIREQVRPYFKQQEYRQGIEAGAREVMRIVSPDYQPPAPTVPLQSPKRTSQPAQSPSLLPIAVIGGGILSIIALAGFAGYARKRRCPRCHRWNKQVTHTVIEEPTTFSGGYNRQNEYCPDCGYTREFFYNTAPLSSGAYWGGGGYSGGGGGFGGGGGGSDFGSGGGGSSGGGGASGDW